MENLIEALGMVFIIAGMLIVMIAACEYVGTIEK